jgi:hypothetical protein
MSLDFPASPTVGQIYTSSPQEWVWDGVKWTALNSTGSLSDFLPLTGGTMTGGLIVEAATALETATAVTPPIADNSTNVATTTFVKEQGYATTAQLSGYLSLTGGTLTGGLTAPSVAVGSGGQTNAGSSNISGNLSVTSTATVGALRCAPQGAGNISSLQNSPITPSTAVLTIDSNTGTPAAFGAWGSYQSAVLVGVSQTTNFLMNFEFWSGGWAGVGSISTNASSVSFNTTSDERLKVNIKEITDVGSVIDQLVPIEFNWASEEEGAPVSYGFSAQAMHSIFPAAVAEGRGEPGDEEFRAWGMDMSKLIPLIVAEIKALRMQVKQQSDRIAELEGK